MNLKSDAKVRWIIADSKELRRIFFELLRRSGGSATKEVEWGEIVSYEKIYGFYFRKPCENLEVWGLFCNFAPEKANIEYDNIIFSKTR